MAFILKIFKTYVLLLFLLELETEPNASGVLIRYSISDTLFRPQSCLIWI